MSRKRSDFIDNASAKTSTGWNSCMGKPMCKCVQSFPSHRRPHSQPAPLVLLPSTFAIPAPIQSFLQKADQFSSDGPRSSVSCSASSSSSPAPTSSSAASRAAAATASPAAGTAVTASTSQPPQYAQFERPRGDDSLPAMPSWKEAQGKKVYDQEHDGLRKDVELGELAGREKEHEQRQPMLATTEKRSLDPVPGYVEMDGSQAGDLGQAAGYRPYGQAYTAYSPVGGNGNSWRNV
ncbi:MAG: hypothetical protein Q9221_004010 [Calogaya cf. arnoldii]